MWLPPDGFLTLDGMASMFAFIAASIALVLAIFAFRRAGLIDRGQLFLDLRTRFREVHREIPTDPKWEPTEEQIPAAQRYWHQSFDEWYLTTQLGDAKMRSLWGVFYSQAIKAGLRRPGLRKHIMRAPEEHLGPMWKLFIEQLDELWKESHPDPSDKLCIGVRCTDDHPLIGTEDR